MSNHTDCYGKMFPDLNALERNCPLEGKAFAVLVRSRGIGVSSRELTLKPKGWDECTACEHYRDCYDLSMAKLALDAALASRT